MQGGFEPVAVLDDIEQLAEEELRNTGAVVTTPTCDGSDEASDVAPIDPDGDDSHNRNGADVVGRTHVLPDKRTTIPHAVLHIFKANVGAGVFLLPSFYNSTGAVVGMCLALITGVIVLDSTVALVNVKHAINNDRVSTYSEVVEHLLGKYPKYFIDASLFATQCGFCVLYLQFSSGLLATLLPFPGDYYFFLSIVTLLLFPLTFLTHRLHILAKASLFAAVCIVCVLTAAFFMATSRIVTKIPSDATFIEPLSRNWISFIAAHILALEGVGVILPVENSVVDKARFPTAMKTTLTVVTVLYVVFGQACYVAFGSSITSSVLAALPDTGISHGCRFALAGSLLFSYPLQFVPAIQIVDRKIGSSPIDTSFILSRAILNVAFAATAAFAGSGAVNKVAELLGAFIGAHLTVFFPTLLSLAADRQNGTLHVFSWKTLKCGVYLLFALTVWSGGTVMSFHNFK